MDTITSVTEEYSCSELDNIKMKIENMSKQHHIEILKILKKNNCIKLNENKSGVFVNLAFLPKSTIDDIVQYIDYIYAQENTIRDLETQQNEFKNIFFNADEKDNVLYSSITR